MKLMRFVLIALALAASTPAVAQTLPLPLVTLPQDASQMRSTINTLINNINNVLRPIFPAAGAINSITLVGGATGVSAKIGLGATADANAEIIIDPNGSGNIVLFQSDDTGNLQFGNSAAFIRANGFSACPAVGKGTLGVNAVVTGHLIVRDWLGTKHGIPTC